MASINDLVTEARKTTNPTLTTVASTRAVSGSSLTCTDLSGWPTNTAVHFITYKKTATGAIDKTTQCDWKGIVSGSTIGTLTLKSGTDAGNAIGDFVEMGPTAAYAQDMAAAIEAEHSTLGVHDATKVAMLAGAQTFTGQKTFTSPKVITDISDTNGNEIFKVTPTASAVNEVTVANAATCNNPTFTASGGDSNVGITFATKGTGKLQGVVENLKNPYKFYVYRNAAYTPTGTNPIQFDTKAFDTSSNVDVVTNKGRFTAPIAGFYFFSSFISISATLSGATGFGISLMKNGSQILGGQLGVETYTGNGNYGRTVSGLLQLSAGDYVEVFDPYAAGKALSVGAINCYFQGFLVSAT